MAVAGRMTTLARRFTLNVNKTHVAINKKVRSLVKRRDALLDELCEIRMKCKHPILRYQYGSNTGNYDPSSDYYWTDFCCPVCGSRWSEAGTANMHDRKGAESTPYSHKMDYAILELK